MILSRSSSAGQVLDARLRRCSWRWQGGNRRRAAPHRGGGPARPGVSHIFSSRWALPERILALSSSHSGTDSIHLVPGGFGTNGQSTANRMRSMPISITQQSSAGLEKFAAGGDIEVVGENIAEIRRFVARPFQCRVDALDLKRQRLAQVTEDD